ncbi:MAG: helix-turn-helix transcriptional regulator, partial [Bacteroidales bacterium]|nr:helix-turn-helix transcriptional regulator [Bacteroidales bacterium]
NCTSADIREITIQFSDTLLDERLLGRNQFASIKRMFESARHGVTFSLTAIAKVYNLLDTLPSLEERFDQFLNMLKILNELSQDKGARILASTSFANTRQGSESRRVLKVKDYISEHYADDLRLEDLAAMVGMAPSAFSRFFKQHTTRNLMDYIIDVRLGKAARMLVDTTTGISEICYACGFNNLSNFNRAFKNRRGYTPRDFRALFTKNRVFV